MEQAGIKHISGFTYEETPRAQSVSGECDLSCANLHVVCQAQDAVATAAVRALKRSRILYGFRSLLPDSSTKSFWRTPNTSRKESLILPTVWMWDQKADRCLWWSVAEASKSSKIAVEATALEGVSELQA